MRCNGPDGSEVPAQIGRGPVGPGAIVIEDSKSSSLDQGVRTAWALPVHAVPSGNPVDERPRRRRVEELAARVELRAGPVVVHGEILHTIGEVSNLSLIHI